MNTERMRLKMDIISEIGRMRNVQCESLKRSLLIGNLNVTEQNKRKTIANLAEETRKLAAVFDVMRYNPDDKHVY